MAVGRKEGDAEIEQLQNTLQALASENQAMDGASTATADTIRNIEAQRDELILEISESNKLLTEARAKVDQYSQRLSESQEKMESLREAHSRETAELREASLQVQERNREIEIKLAQAEAHLDESNKRADAAQASADHYSQQLRAAQEKMESLRTAHSLETAELRETLNRAQERNRDLEIKLVRAEALSRGKREKGQMAKPPSSSTA